MAEETSAHAESKPSGGQGSIPFRRLSQLAFAFGSLLTAIQFHRFVDYVSQTAPPVEVLRPAEVDAWLPISSFVSLFYWIRTGIANTVHPAGLVLFTLTLLLALALRRGFCSWVCPVGTLSEYAHLAGRLLFKRNFVLPRPLDILLRGIKYLLLGLFVVLIGNMSVEALRDFIHGSYNRICDVKMYALFASPSATTLTVVSVLGLLSLFFKNFACRYLCPYGALLGLTSIPSPTAVRRDATRCTGCGACTAACPSRIDVHAKTVVRSPECTACYGCVSVCPQPETLNITLGRARRITPALYALLLLAAFLLIPHAFQAFGYWQTDTPSSLYQQLVPRLHETAHPSSK